MSISTYTPFITVFLITTLCSGVYYYKKYYKLQKNRIINIWEKKIDIFGAVKFILRNYGLSMEWISLGSGFGATEKLISNQGIYFKSLIDPSPEYSLRWTIKPTDENCFMPTHKTIQDLLKDTPELINNDNTVLMIDWPYAIGCDETSITEEYPPTEYPYDIEGISLLLPKIVIIRYSETGESGTRTLHVWLNLSGGNGGGRGLYNSWHSYHIPEILEKIKYKVVYSSSEDYYVNEFFSLKSIQNIAVLERY